MSGSRVLTFLVFRNLAFHSEIRVDGFPVAEEGWVVNFDLRIKDPSNVRKEHPVQGDFKIVSRKLQYRHCLCQYLELEPD